MAVMMAAMIFMGTGNNVFANDEVTYDSNMQTKKFDVDVKVGEDGSYTVTENIKVKFVNPRHGIYRYIPYKGKVITSDKNGDQKKLLYYADFTLLSNDSKTDVDEDSDMRANYRFHIAAVSEKLFAGSRGYRLNYYAVTAELARVYLYAGKNAEAYAEAKKIIDEESKTGYFKASTNSTGFRNGNMKMYNDIIFGLYSPKELVEWDQEINHATDGDSQESYLCLDSDVAKDLYGDEIDSDWRFNYQLEEKYYGYYYRTLKYYKQTENKSEGKISNRTLPMIRMSEVYYIAAEAIFDTNPKEAQGYLELVKKGRGISKKFDNVTNKSEFINLLVNDARREFLGEGQIFYMYKRLNRLMPASSFYDSDVLPTDENMVLPKPDSESNI
jgi:hypothetical protein